MPTSRETDVRELMGKCSEKLRTLRKELDHFENDLIVLSDEQVTKLRQRIRECEAEFERLKLGL